MSYVLGCLQHQYILNFEFKNAGQGSKTTGLEVPMTQCLFLSEMLEISPLGGYILLEHVGKRGISPLAVYTKEYLYAHVLNCQ